VREGDPERRSSRPPPSAAARLARLGLGADALGPLERLGLDVEGDAALVAALAAGADPARALAAFERMAERAEPCWAALRARARRLAAAGGGTASGPDPVRRGALLAGVSDALADLMVTDPGLLAVLTSRLASQDTAAMRVHAARALRGAPDPARALARAQRRGLARIAARDLTGAADTMTVARELSELAEGVLAAALDRARATAGTDAPLAVLAMGKLGGGELNYVSDVDVLFVAGDDVTGATRVAAALLRLCGTVTPEGRAYEVDANLRPEGRDGPLVRSLDGYRAYYDRWASAWEAQALLKARPIAGDAALGEEFVAAVAPFVWPDRREAAAITELQRLKGVVEQSPRVRRAGEREMKLAPGGLRDIEFSVQLLQLVHGRHDPSLRLRGTLPALRALADGGYVGEQDAALFSRAYAFLRAIEHRLQLRGLRRTHALPADPAARDRLARAMEYRNGPDASAVEQLDAELRRVRGQVREVHQKLFYRPLLGRFAELGRDEVVAADGTGHLDRDAVRDRLVALGFDQPDAAVRALDALAGGGGRRARLLRTLLPALLPALAATPSPDAGLAALRSLAERLDASPTFQNALRDRPPVAELLATVLGRSPLVGRWLERQPEVLGVLADDDALGARREHDEYRRMAEGLARRHHRAPGADPRHPADGADARQDEAQVGDALRRLARRELARTAVRELSGRADVADVAVELSGLAEACLEVAIATVRPAGVDLAVVGMGKLGGRELAYGSDLDVLFLYEPAEARTDALRAVERLLRLLSGPTAEGRAFVVDPGLRPEGRDGPLARTLESYRIYYERWAAPWELQALTQARHVAGDRALGRAFVDVLSGLVYPPQPLDDRLDAVRAMKRRVEEERPRAAGIDVKLSPGGLADIEWTVQLLQLAHGGSHPALRRRGTFAALSACESEGLLDAEDAAVLRVGALLCVGLRHAGFLAGLRDPNAVPSGQDLERVAGLVPEGADGGAALREILEATMARVREVHQRVFYAPMATR